MLIVASKKLIRYFLAHPIVVRTYQPLKQVVFMPYLAGRMTKWFIGLLELDINFEVRKTLKAQVFSDFLAELTPQPSESCTRLTVFTERSFNLSRSGAGLILENDKCLSVKMSIQFSFPTTNNQAEYEAFITGLNLALVREEARKTKIISGTKLPHITIF